MTPPNDELEQAKAKLARLRAENDRKQNAATDAINRLEKAIDADEERAKKGK